MGMGSVCLCENTGHHCERVFGYWAFYPYFGFLNEVEWEGGIFFQMKGKGRDGVILFLGKTKQNNNTELDYMVRM